MVLAAIDGRVRVPDLDRDAPPKLLAVGAGPDARYGLNERGLAVINVTCGADVDLRLARQACQESPPPPPPILR